MTDTVLRDALENVVSGRDLDVATARQAMDHIMEGRATAAQLGALLAALRTKGESVDELTGFVESIRDHSTRVSLRVSAIDTCGTGGDGLGTFNISTAAALVVAGAGCAVAKHGNRSASSLCGSADVLGALGVTTSLPPSGVERCVEGAGIGFMYAPLYHPAMRHAAGPRSELGIRTVFNILGPLANPARVRRQVLGVADADIAPKMAQVLQRLGIERAWVVTGPDGMDELGVAGPAYGYDVSPAGVTEFVVDPAALGLPAAPVDALRGGDASTNAARIRAVLDGEDGAAADVVKLNAAAGLLVAGSVATLEEGMARAAESIASGAARERLRLLVELSREAAA